MQKFKVSNSWFTVEIIDDCTFAISEYMHWEETHSYLLIGAEKALLIDTMLGVANIKSVIDTLTELPIKWLALRRVICAKNFIKI